MNKSTCNPWQATKKQSWFSWLLIVLLCSSLFATEGSSAERSVYSSLRKCRNTTYQGQPARECKGVVGWRLIVVSEPERSYLVLRRKGYDKSLRDDIFSEEIGHFPDIPVASRVEWRLGSTGRPHAVIFRVSAVDPNKSLQEDSNPYKSSLLVVRLGQTACTLGVVNDNKLARELADSDAGCEKDHRVK